MSQHLLLIGREPARLRESDRFSDIAEADWQVSLAANRAEATQRLKTQVFEAVVADIQLPDGTGTQILDLVLQQQPNACRFLLANFADRNVALKCVGTAHAFLSSPCDGSRLLAALDRARQVDAWLGNDNVRQLMSQVEPVFSPPFTYFQIVKELRSPNASLESVGQIVGQDPALSGKLLQLVNSSAFGLKRQVSAPADAVMFLGIETTKSLVLLAHSYSHFDHLSNVGFSVESLWRHSLTVARFARRIAERELAEEGISDQSFTAGLIHDIGKLILASQKPETYQQVSRTACEQKISLWEAEQALFGATHAEVGAWLAATWGLPLPIVEAVALHHYPTRFFSQTFCPLTAVHVANIVEHEQSALRGATQPPTVDVNYLGSLSLEGRLPAWRTACPALSPQSSQAN